MQYVPLYDKTSHSIHVYFSDRKGNLDSTYMYLHTIKPHIQFIIFCLQSEEVVLAVCTSIQYYLTFSLFFVTVQSDRRGSLGSMYLHTIKSHIQFIIFCLQSEEVVLAVCTCTSTQYYLTFSLFLAHLAIGHVSFCHG